MQTLIEKFIFEVLSEKKGKSKEKVKKVPTNLLVEPDFTHDDGEDPSSHELPNPAKIKKMRKKMKGLRIASKKEVSAGGVAGAMVTFGAPSASYPNPEVGSTKKHKH